jgi:very-short-patch-repair endonuclease
VRRVRGVNVHHSRRPDPGTTKRGIPVTRPMRTVADLARVLRRRDVVRALEQAEVLRLLDVAALPPALRRVAAAHDLAPTRSELEAAFLALCRRRGLPPPRVNTVVEGFEVDFAWPEQRLIVETDGYRRHGTRAAFERDRARDAALTAAGWRVVRFTHRQVLRGGAGPGLDRLIASPAGSAPARG